MYPSFIDLFMGIEVSSHVFHSPIDLLLKLWFKSGDLQMIGNQLVYIGWDLEFI